MNTENLQSRKRTVARIETVMTESSESTRGSKENHPVGTGVQGRGESRHPSRKKRRGAIQSTNNKNGCNGRDVARRGNIAREGRLGLPAKKKNG